MRTKALLFMMLPAPLAAACGGGNLEPLTAPLPKPDSTYALHLDASKETCNTGNTTLPDLQMAPSGPLSLEAPLGCDAATAWQQTEAGNAWTVWGACAWSQHPAWRLPPPANGGTDYAEPFSAQLRPLGGDRWEVLWTWYPTTGPGYDDVGGRPPAKCVGAVVTAEPAGI